MSIVNEAPGLFNYHDNILSDHFPVFFLGWTLPISSHRRKRRPDHLPQVRSLAPQGVLQVHRKQEVQKGHQLRRSVLFSRIL